jgi:hypothetical protein
MPFSLLTFCMADQAPVGDRDSWGIRIESALAVTRFKVIEISLSFSLSIFDW